MSDIERVALNFSGYLARITDDEVAAVAFLLAGELFKRGISGFGALFAASEELRHRARFPQPAGYPIFSGDCALRPVHGVAGHACDRRCNTDL